MIGVAAVVVVDFVVFAACRDSSCSAKAVADVMSMAADV